MGQFYFIKTKDLNTAERLRKEGYQELPMENNVYVFVNNRTTTFSSDSVHYSNKISL